MGGQRGCGWSISSALATVDDDGEEQDEDKGGF
jgi:hypothetical protein